MQSARRIGRTLLIVFAVAGARPELGRAQQPSKPPTPTVVAPTQRTAAESTATALGKPMTNADIANLIKTSGLSEDQVKARLQAAGYDPSLAEPFFASDQTQAAAAASIAANPAFAKALADVTPPSQPLDTTQHDTTQAPTKPLPTADDKAMRVFGKRIFAATSSSFAPPISGVIDAGYRLGNGDQLQLVVTGQVELAYSLDVRPDGTVIIPTIGQVSVAGLTLDAARTLIKSRAGRFYSGLSDGKTSLDLSVSRIRNIQVFVIGEVEHPGAYEISALATAFHALSRAGGPTIRGTFRNIEVRRGGSVVRHIDLYDYLLRGDASNDIRLEQGDILFIGLNRRAVAIAGEVRRPAIFELMPTDGFRSLIDFAGGLGATAATDRLQIDRILPPAERKPGHDRAIIDIPLRGQVTSLDTVNIVDGDSVTVFQIDDLRRNQVEIDGAVFAPGQYEWRTGLTLDSLVQRAGGPRPSALTDRVKVTRPILRTGRQQIFSLDLADPKSAAFALQEFDSVKVLDGKLSYPAGTVTIAGAVFTPATLHFVEHMTLKDLVELANGMQPWAILDQVQIVRRDSASGKRAFFSIDYRDPGAQLFPLQRMDDITVLDSRASDPTRMVTILGAVVTPGTRPFADGMTLGDLMATADGVREEAQYVDVARPRREVTYSDTLSTLRRFPLDRNLKLSPEALRFPLERFDQVSVRSGPGFRAGASVTVDGAFAYPGTYSIERDGERVSSVLKRAGGLLPTAYTGSFRLTRAGRPVPIDLNKVFGGDKLQDIPLMDGDQLQIDANTGVVFVGGAVERQVAVPFNASWVARDYIDAAGGYTLKANKSSIVAVYPSGAVKRFARHFWQSEPKLAPGTTITVGTLDDTDKGDWKQTLATAMQIAATISSLIIGIVAVRKL